MSISKKPKTKAETSEAEVQALISKGGSPASSSQSQKSSQKNIVPITLRLPAELTRRIEVVIQKRAFKIPRHTWLLEAVIEKLEREE